MPRQRPRQLRAPVSEPLAGPAFQGRLRSLLEELTPGGSGEFQTALGTLPSRALTEPSAVAGGGALGSYPGPPMIPGRG